jgi:acyl-CoA synthetase (AMP-forming)/AMP-acid ligase II/alkylation response protein AidB-like acyl-CoA dehydrogenase
VRTLVDLLLERATHRGEQLAYAFLENGADEAGRLTYAALDRQARAIAAHLQALDAAGERALLLYPAGLQLLAGLFGCLYAGVIAIPAPPPEASRLKRSGPRLRAIADDAQASLVLTTRGLVDEADRPLCERRPLRWLETDRIDPELADHWREPGVSDSHLAYLQYTSGSTSTPKGVMISHRNLLAHLSHLQQECQYTPDSVTVTWMPYFHDYGLVEGLLEPLYNATPCYVMSPVAFIKRPFHWLRAICRYRGTHSQAPNFAYDHCVRRVTPEQRAQLDLRGWRAAGNAAEPINPRVMAAFQETFGPCGFAWRTFSPAYGLAEATLLVSSTPQQEEPVVKRLQAAALEANRVALANGEGGLVREVVGCGRVFAATPVAIAQPETLTRCAPGEVGEIWVGGPAVAEGYWQRPEETERTFRARLRDTGEGPFLRTGDLGFVEDGQLFITGRLKDVIIIRGTNHYPQDVEWTVQGAHPALRPENGAAFSVMVDGEEKLVVVQEVEREHVPNLNVAEVVQAIRQAVAEGHELDVHSVQLLRRGSLPKTSSGKIQRSACRAAFGHDNPDVLAAWTAPTPAAARPVAASVPLARSEQKPASGTRAATGEPANGTPAVAGAAAEVSRRRGDDLIGWLREYAADRINSRLMDERRCIPPYILLDFGNRGLLGMQVAETYGGLALRYADFFRVLEQLAAIDLTLGAVVFLNNSNGIRPIQHFATPALRDELLPLLARGRELASFALTEPGAGSNLGGLACVARPAGEAGWRLRGVKRWNASSWAGVVSVFARLAEPDGRPGAVTGFAVRQGSPGLRVGPEALTVGLRGSVQNALYLHDVPVGPANLLGELRKGMVVAEDALLVGRLCTAAVCLGGLKRCAQLMVRYAGRRLIATGRLLDNPVTLAKLSDLTAMIAATESLLGGAAALLDAGESLPQELAMAAKVTATEQLSWATGELLQLLGGRGYMENNIGAQLWRDARALTVGEGPNESLTLFLGRSATDADMVGRLLRERFDAGPLAGRLHDAAQQIRARCLGPGAPFPERPAALAWAHTLAGKAAADAFLVAAVEAAARRQPGRHLSRVAEWARLRFEATLDRALRGELLEPVLLTAPETADLVLGYAGTIGDVEQTLPGEEDALDPLLRRAPAAADGPAEALPGAVAVTGDLPAANTEPAPPPAAPPARTPASAKRDLLERVLRERLGRSGGKRPGPATTTTSDPQETCS